MRNSMSGKIVIHRHKYLYKYQLRNDQNRCIYTYQIRSTSAGHLVFIKYDTFTTHVIKK